MTSPPATTPATRFSLPRREEGWEANLGKIDLRGLRVAVAPNLGNAVVDPEIERIVQDAAVSLVDVAGLRRVDIDVKVPENGLAWARAGLPSLLVDLGDILARMQGRPDVRDPLWDGSRHPSTVPGTARRREVPVSR